MRLLYNVIVVFDDAFQSFRVSEYVVYSSKLSCIFVICSVLIVSIWPLGRSGVDCSVVLLEAIVLVCVCVVLELAAIM